MNKLKGEVCGTYGSQATPCAVYQVEDRRGMVWYAVEGSTNVNLTYPPLRDGVDVEALIDEDTFTWPDGIYSVEDLEAAIEG